MRDGERSVTTGDLYARQLRTYVLLALGELRVREVTVSRVDAFLREVRQRNGVPTARTCRSMVSGVLGLAVRHDAVSTNAARETSRIPAKPAREPRALITAEGRALRARLAADPQAVVKTCRISRRGCSAPGCGSGRRWR